MKKSELLFGAILLPIDYIMLVLAGITAYLVRFTSTVRGIQPAVYEIPFNQYVSMVLLTAVGGVIIFGWSGLYTLKATRRIIEEWRKVFLACSTGVLIIIILFFLQRGLFSSRFIIVVAYFFAVVYVAAARLGVLLLTRQLFKRGIGVRRAVLVGGGRISRMIANEIAQKKGLGLFATMQVPAITPDARQQILAAANQGVIDELIQSDPNLPKEQTEELYQLCDDHHIVFKYAAALFDTQSTNVAIQPIAGIPIIEIKKTTLDGWGRIIKRIFDVITATILIVSASPMMLAVILAIWLTTGRPIFFSRRDDQSIVKRIGQFGQPFFYFKFRTMQQGTDSWRMANELQQRNLRKGSPLFKVQNDPRVTRIGKWLRKFSLDELPELFLVLKGDMSLVGPRPHLPEEVAKYQQHHKKVLSVKPGMTGLAQISGRSDLDFEDEVRLDTFYIENWSLWLDLVILFKTPLILLKSRKAW